MKRIAQFEKVSFEQFYEALKENFQIDKIEEIYKDIKLPQRATSGSAGYDFYMPYFLEIEPLQTYKIPTGIRVKIEQGWFLSIYPRSSLGFKYRLQLNNTVGIIDSDYYNATNEGHIFIKIYNSSNEKITLSKGAGFAQGIFMEYGITYDDDVSSLRTGGIGSTNK